MALMTNTDLELKDLKYSDVKFRQKLSNKITKQHLLANNYNTPNVVFGRLLLQSHSQLDPMLLG